MNDIYIPHGVIPAVLLPFDNELRIDEAAYRGHLRDLFTRVHPVRIRRGLALALSGNWNPSHANLIFAIWPVQAIWNPPTANSVSQKKVTGGEYRAQQRRRNASDYVRSCRRGGRQPQRRGRDGPRPAGFAG